jgi:hypothetical protein
MPDPEMLRGPEGARDVYLLDVATDYEARLLRSWLARSVASPDSRRIKSSRRRRSKSTDDLTDLLDEGSDAFLIPVRVLWMAPEKEETPVGWSDAFAW